MKKICFLLIAFLIFFVACDKENNIENHLKIGEQGAEFDRFFDPEYVEHLFEMSQIDPEELSQDPLFEKFYLSAQDIQECFKDKFFWALENDPDLANDMSNDIFAANDAFTSGDTLFGLEAMQEAYNVAGCLSMEPVFYYNVEGDEIAFGIPIDDIAEQVTTANENYNFLLESYPTLNEIEEQYREDIITLAIIWYEQNLEGSKYVAPPRNCNAEYNAAVGHALVEGLGCQAIVNETCFWNPIAYAIGTAACLAFYTYNLN